MPISSENRETFNTICERIANGESLRGICKDEGMPDKATVLRWLVADDGGELRDQYARAREWQAELLADELVDIADDGSNDWMEREGEGNAGWELNGEHIQRSRLRIDTRKWAASKLRPKVYGDKVQQEQTGGFTVEVVHNFKGEDG